MSIARFRPEIWSANLLVALRKALVFGSPMVVNKDYEGEISEAGDTVRITSISRPQVQTYTPNQTVITFPELTDAQRTLTIDQSKYWAATSCRKPRTRPRSPSPTRSTSSSRRCTPASRP